jgi:hypothetical protein
VRELRRATGMRGTDHMIIITCFSSSLPLPPPTTSPEQADAVQSSRNYPPPYPSPLIHRPAPTPKPTACTLKVALKPPPNRSQINKESIPQRYKSLFSDVQQKRLFLQPRPLIRAFTDSSRDGALIGRWWMRDGIRGRAAAALKLAACWRG